MTGRSLATSFSGSAAAPCLSRSDLGQRTSRRGRRRSAPGPGLDDAEAAEPRDDRQEARQEEDLHENLRRRAEDLDLARPGEGPECSGCSSRSPRTLIGESRSSAIAKPRRAGRSRSRRPTRAGRSSRLRAEFRAAAGAPPREHPSRRRRSRGRTREGAGTRGAEAGRSPARPAPPAGAPAAPRKARKSRCRPGNHSAARGKRQHVRRPVFLR